VHTSDRAGEASVKAHAPPGIKHAIEPVPQLETPLRAPSIIETPFASEEQVQQAIRRRRLIGIDPQTIIQDAIQRAKGRV